MVFCMVPTAQLELLLDIEARHEDLLRRLDELDQRVEKALAECQGGTVPIFVSAKMGLSPSTLGTLL